MLTTNPEHNKPKECVCVKCGKKFIRSPWTGVYSTYKSKSYKYYTPDPIEPDYPDSVPRLVTLCDSCATEELKAGKVGGNDSGNVNIIMY